MVWRNTVEQVTVTARGEKLVGQRLRIVRNVDDVALHALANCRATIRVVSKRLASSDVVLGRYSTTVKHLVGGRRGTPPGPVPSTHSMRITVAPLHGALKIRVISCAVEIPAIPQRLMSAFPPRPKLGIAQPKQKSKQAPKKTKQDRFATTHWHDSVAPSKHKGTSKGKGKGKGVGSGQGSHSSPRQEQGQSREVSLDDLASMMHVHTHRHQPRHQPHDTPPAAPHTEAHAHTHTRPHAPAAYKDHATANAHTHASAGRHGNHAAIAQPALRVAQRAHNISDVRRRACKCCQLHGTPHTPLSPPPPPPPPLPRPPPPLPQA